MEYNLDDYKEYRKNKLNKIYKNMLKYKSLINKIQNGGSITKEDIDIKYNEIREKLKKIAITSKEIKNTTCTNTCCSAFEKQNIEIDKLIDLLKNQ